MNLQSCIRWGRCSGGCGRRPAGAAADVPDSGRSGPPHGSGGWCPSAASLTPLVSARLGR